MRVESINIGQPNIFTYGETEIETAIYKQSIGNERIYLDKLNLKGDAQANLKVHGGPDKAICVYSHDHYSYWEEILKVELSLGAFGENLTLHECDEDSIFLGDIYSFGEATLQVTQPRQPCMKLAKRYQLDKLPQLVIESGFTGFYMRVVEEGYVSIDDSIQLVERHPKKVSISTCNHALYNKNNTEATERVLEVNEIAESLRRSLLKKK